MIGKTEVKGTVADVVRIRLELEAVKAEYEEHSRMYWEAMVNTRRYEQRELPRPKIKQPSFQWGPLVFAIILSAAIIAAIIF